MGRAAQSLFGVFVLALVGASAANAGPFEDAMAAYNSGDYTAAVGIFRPLADRGDAMAQYRLGFMYLEGRGVPQDHVRAHMWFNLSAARGSLGGAAMRDQLAKQRMTPAQIAEAQKLAREWKPTAEH
jgi:TPR repeat protein